ncbi:MAG: 50S ribosomal protein L25 [bacterium]
MSPIILEAKKREVTGKKAKKFLKEGNVLGVVYGHKVDNRNILLNSIAFKKAYDKAGESTLIDLKIDGEEPVKAIIKDTQMDLSGEKFIHVDFHQVNMNEKLTTDIALKFVGESRAVKELGGMLLKNIDFIPVECLPKDLVHEIDVDISSLDDFDKSIHVKDLKMPEGVIALTDPEEAVVFVEAPRAEEEIKPAVEAVAPEGAKKEEASADKGKKDEKNSDKK